MSLICAVRNVSGTSVSPSTWPSRSVYATPLVKSVTCFTGKALGAPAGCCERAGIVADRPTIKRMPVVDLVFIWNLPSPNLSHSRAVVASQRAGTLGRGTINKEYHR